MKDFKTFQEARHYLLNISAERVRKLALVAEEMEANRKTYSFNAEITVLRDRLKAQNDNRKAYERAMKRINTI